MIGELYCGVKKTDIETLNFIKEKECEGEAADWYCNNINSASTVNYIWNL